MTTSCLDNVKGGVSKTVALTLLSSIIAWFPHATRAPSQQYVSVLFNHKLLYTAYHCISLGISLLIECKYSIQVHFMPLGLPLHFLLKS